MIEVKWLNDGRSSKPDDYLIPWNDDKSRQKAFLSGWQLFLNEGSYKKNVLHWFTVGAYFASVLGDLPRPERRMIYYASLAEYLKSQKCSHWSDEQRYEALQLAREAPDF